MLRRPLLPLAAIAAFMLTAAAQAQEPPPPAPAAPSSATGHRTYNADQMHDFARATVELQALGSQDPAAMTRAIQGAGMSVEDYNQMGDAMRGDPALAASLNPYLDSANSERVARFYRAQAQVQPAARSTPPRHTTSSRQASSHKSSGHKASSRKAASRSPRHGKSHSTTTASRHATKKGASHAASSHKASSKSKAHRAATPAHTSKHHKRS